MVFHTLFHRNVKYHVKLSCENPVKRAPHFHLVFHGIVCEIPCENYVKTECKRQLNIPVKMDVKIITK